MSSRIGGMAFGESWGIMRSFREQILAMGDNIPTGPHGEAVFDTHRPPIAESTWYVFEVSLSYFVECRCWSVRRSLLRQHSRDLQHSLPPSLGLSALIGPDSTSIWQTGSPRYVIRAQNDFLSQERTEG